MKIRKAKRQDINEIVELYIKFFKYMRKFAKFVKNKKENSVNKEELKKFLAKRIKPSNKELFLVAEENKKLLGFIASEIMSSRESRTDKKVLEVVDVYVDNKRKGVGKKLFIEVEKWARLNNIRFIQWEYLYGNKTADSFCVKNKFKHFKVKMLKKLK